MSSYGFVDIQHEQIKRYMEALESMSGVCKIPPVGRFQLGTDGMPTFSGLVCHPADMGGDATGIGASGCLNCAKG